MCQVIQFIGGLLCTAVLISSFFFVGWLKALLGLAVFSFVITPIVEIIIGRIGAAINIPYQKV
jgi:multisubunit Na+/H+ antiporter MnhG subunit